MKKRMIMLCLIAVFLSLLPLSVHAAENTLTSALYDGKIEMDIDELFKNLMGSGTAEDPFLVSSREDLVTISERVNSGNTEYAGAHFRQTAEICLDGTDFLPIGTKDHPFTGSYDGGGYLIAYDNWTLVGSHGGVFGYAKNASFTDMVVDMDLTVDNPTGRVMAGMICAEYESTTLANNPVIERCYAMGSIKVSSGRMGGYAGGLFGRVLITWGSFSIADCMSRTDIFSDSTTSYAGGLIAYLGCPNARPANIARCYSTGNIYAIGSIATFVGGIVAYFYTESYVTVNSSKAETALFAVTDEKHYTIENCMTACQLDYQSKSRYEIGSIAGYFVFSEPAGADGLLTRNLFDIGTGLTKTSEDSLNGTVREPGDVLDYSFLRDGLGFDMDNVWIAIGDDLRLVSHYAELVEYSANCGLDSPRYAGVRAVNSADEYTLVFAEYGASGRLKKVHMTDVSTPDNTLTLGLTADIQRVEIFGMDKTGLKPLFRKKLSCFARLSSTGEPVQPA